MEHFWMLWLGIRDGQVACSNPCWLYNCIPGSDRLRYQWSILLILCLRRVGSNKRTLTEQLMCRSRVSIFSAHIFNHHHQKFYILYQLLTISGNTVKRSCVTVHYDKNLDKKTLQRVWHRFYPNLPLTCFISFHDKLGKQQILKSDCLDMREMYFCVEIKFARKSDRVVPGGQRFHSSGNRGDFTDALEAISIEGRGYSAGP